MPSLEQIRFVPPDNYTVHIAGLSVQLIGLLYCITLPALTGDNSPGGLVGMTLELKVLHMFLGWQCEDRQHSSQCRKGW